MIQPDYLLTVVIGWLKAWENYKGYVWDIGALPGIVIGVEAGILQREDSEIRGKRYRQSKKRADFNLLLLQSEAKGWLARVPHPSSPLHSPWHYFERFSSPMTWLFTGSSELARAFADESWTPDFSWWIITDNALHDAQMQAEMIKQGQKGPLGFRSSRPEN